MKGKERVETLFSQFKDKYAFDNWQQAKMAMDTFLDALRTDPQYRTGRFLRLMEEQCIEAVADAERNREQFVVPGPYETWEWHIDPSGVALEHRAYELTWADELTIMASPSHRFPADYTLLVLGSSVERDTIDFGTFKERTGLTAEEIYHLVRQMPAQAYTGRLSALSRILISEGALHYYLEYGASTMGLSGHLIWPRMYATKCGIKHI